MLLRFFKNVERELFTYTNPAQIFDPRINKYWFANRDHFLVKDFFDFIKQLYTKDNILNNPTLVSNVFGNIGSNANANLHIQNLINTIPENKLWVLNYYSYQSANSTTTSICIYKPQARITNLETIFACRFDDSFDVIEANYLSLEFCQKLYNEKLIPIIDRLEMLFTAHATKTFHYNNLISANTFVRLLGSMTCGGNYILRQNVSEPLNAHQLSTLNSDAEIMVRHYDGPVPNLEFISIKVIQKVSKSSKSMLHTVFSYSQNPMEILPYPIKMKNEHNPVLYGVELECSTDYPVSAIINATDEPFMLAKQDASISGNKRHRYELVTIPMSFKAHKREWAKWFSNLDYDKFDTTKDTNNGMHVHIGRTHFDNENHIRNLAWFINNPANYDFMVALSERTAQSMATYAPVRPFGESASKVRSMRNIVPDLRNMRGACNVGTGKGTVEVRLFRGIVSYAAVLKNLECVDAMFNYTQEYPIYKMNVRSFVSWLEQQPYNKYPVFKKFVFSIKSLKQMMTASDMYDIIFTTRDATKISTKLNKAGVKITNEHVTLLNKKLKKRTFVLNKETGALDVVYTNKFSLAHMDRELEKRYVNR